MSVPWARNSTSPVTESPPGRADAAVAGASMLGYFALAAAWLVQRGVQLAADRAAARSLREGVRRNALGFIAGATLVRLWIVTLTILIVGTAGTREAGLSAALLALVLVTV